MLWLATWGAGLVRFDPKLEVFTSFTADDASGLSSDHIYRLYPDPKDKKPQAKTLKDIASLKDAAASREISMGKAVAQTAFHRDVMHFAYPFGERASFNRQHVMLAREAGFASAVTALPGIVLAEGRSNLHALPRIAWDGRQRSLRAMRVILSGMTFTQANRARGV